MTEVPFRHGVTVIPAGTGGRGSEGIARGRSWREHGRAFFHGAVHFRRGAQAVPVGQFGHARFIDDLDGDGLVFAEAEERTGNGAVVADGPYHFAGLHFHVYRADAQGEIGFGSLLRTGIDGSGGAEGGEEMPAIHSFYGKGTGG